MTSSEADRFMREHSAVAVRVTENGYWVAWDLFISKYPFDTNLVRGCTREEAIANYRDIHHPEKPRSAYNDHFAQQAQVFADSVKYRRIVELFITTYPIKMSFASGSFCSDISSIIESDLPTHCDKCNQELK